MSSYRVVTMAMLSFCMLVGLSSWTTCVSGRPSSALSDSDALVYLTQFGYMEKPKSSSGTSSALIHQDTVVSAIREFQEFSGLNATGELDSATMYMMSLPRCGVKDKIGSNKHRSKRYALQGSRWKVRNLKYKITKYPKQLSQRKVDNIISEAFKVWSDHTNLNFTVADSNHIHIEIRFENGEHGDGDPFDGPGGTLAHAYFPIFGGDAHFDASESWTVGSQPGRFSGTDLFQVAAHEFGHSLGLSHSDVKTSLMAPFYRGYDPHFQLDEDDIMGIQQLYGERKSHETGEESRPSDRHRPPRPTKTPPSHSSPELCSGARIDSIFTSADSRTYVTKGKQYWELTDERLAAGYPKYLSTGWPGLNAQKIDAVFTYTNGKTYFFSGSKYWRFVGKKMDGDYPKLISDGFPGIPNNLDAVMVWSGNGKIYFFKGDKFWRFNPSERPPVSSTYPKSISNWEGIPNDLDAAFKWTNGYTYFFKGSYYYRFHDRNFAVDQADPPFPRLTSEWWFGCPKQLSKLTSANRESELKNSFLVTLKDRSINDKGNADISDEGSVYNVDTGTHGAVSEQIVEPATQVQQQSAGVLMAPSVGVIAAILLLIVTVYLYGDRL